MARVARWVTRPPRRCRPRFATNPNSTCPISVLRFRRVEIRDSAHKHRIADDDIRHAIDHALVVADLDVDKVLYLGPDRAANLLEVVAVRRVGTEALVIHAMRMHTRYQSYLRGQGDDDG